jgi:hypothetical protein
MNWPNFEELVRNGNLQRNNEEELHHADAWLGINPFLRLYHVFMDDDVRLAFETKDNKKTCAEIDARNSKECPPTFFELASILYNDKDFNPVTYAYPNP